MEVKILSIRQKGVLSLGSNLTSKSLSIYFYIERQQFGLTEFICYRLPKPFADIAKLYGFSLRKIMFISDNQYNPGFSDGRLFSCKSEDVVFMDKDL